MNENDLRRTRVLSAVLTGSMTTLAASRSLGVSDRQTRRLLERMRSDGAGALAHRSRGRTPNNVTPDALRAHVLTLVRTQYAGFGPTFATEKLLEHDEIQVSRETLRKWMRDDGIWLTRSQRRSFHQSRIRRERLGELTQIDGSEHRWFGPNRPSCTLLVFIDDATSRLMTLLFEPPRVYRRVKYSKDEPYDEPEIHCCLSC